MIDVRENKLEGGRRRRVDKKEEKGGRGRKMQIAYEGI